jgi:hypothetical protein
MVWWVKNSIGAALILVLLAFAVRVFIGSATTFEATRQGIKFTTGGSPTISPKGEIVDSNGKMVTGAASEIRPESKGTVWTSQCPVGTEVVSGWCTEREIIGSPVALQNVGPERELRQWQCAWVAPVKADVGALCVVR